MKAIKTIVAAALLAMSALASARTIEVEVNGLVCAFCAQGIEKTLRRFPATDDVFVSLEHRLVAVSLKDSGYDVVSIQRVDQPVAEIRQAAKAR